MTNVTTNVTNTLHTSTGDKCDKYTTNQYTVTRGINTCEKRTQTNNELVRITNTCE